MGRDRKLKMLLEYKTEDGKGKRAASQERRRATRHLHRVMDLSRMMMLEYEMKQLIGDKNE